MIRMYYNFTFFFYRRSIELVELLLYLAECGLYYEVQECLKFPIKKCPDILALALMESNGPLNMIRHEIISSIIPIFLGNHNNAATILQHAWNHQVLHISYNYCIILLVCCIDLNDTLLSDI